MKCEIWLVSLALSWNIAKSRMTFHIRNWRMNSVTDMVLQNSIHPHPGTGVHLNYALTGNQSQIAQGLKGLIFILDIGIIPGTITSPIHPLTYQFYYKTGNSQCSTGGSTKPSSHPFFFPFFFQWTAPDLPQRKLCISTWCSPFLVKG